MRAVTPPTPPTAKAEADTTTATTNEELRRTSSYIQYVEFARSRRRFTWAPGSGKAVEDWLYREFTGDAPSPSTSVLRFVQSLGEKGRRTHSTGERAGGDDKVTNLSCSALPNLSVKLTFTLDSWDNNIYNQPLSDPLVILSRVIVDSHKLLGKLGVPEIQFYNFLQQIQTRYMHSNTYHNSFHASDVLYTLNIMVSQPVLHDWLTPLEMFVMLVAAIVHDVGHDGFNNDYHNNTKSPIALEHEFTSPQENNHLKITLMIMAMPSCNFLDYLPEGSIGRFKEILVGLVLGTDMKNHFGLLGDVQCLIGDHGPDFRTWPRTDDTFMKLARFLLHCADISNPSKPTDLSKKWTHNIMEEFFRQGDAERARGMPISPMCDRDACSVPLAQIGFINYIVLPTFKLLAQLLPGLEQPALGNIIRNLEYWKSVSE